MRLTLEAFRRTITLSIEKDATDADEDEDEQVRDHLAATVEVAGGWRDDYAVDCRFGFASLHAETLTDATVTEETP